MTGKVAVKENTILYRKNLKDRPKELACKRRYPSQEHQKGLETYENKDDNL
jgi:hypothetical protein